jgi:hypothetical protein
MYRKTWRPAIVAKVEAAWRSSRGKRDDVREWWNCFIDDSVVDEDAPPDSDAEEIPEPPPRKIGISAADADDEVRRFLDVSPTCPYFNVIYQGELKKYMARALAPG